MGPKGIGPQNLGVGMAKMSNCGCSQCDCDSSPTKNVNKGYGHDLESPAKIAGVLASALVGKAVDKLAK